MKAPKLTFLPVVALLLVLPPALSARVQSPKELLEIIREKEDRAPAGVYDQLARLGSPAAFKASKKAVDELRMEYALNRAYQAFRLYEGELQVEAVDWLSKQASGHRREENQRAAVRGLGTMGAVAEEQLEKIVRRHKDATCRQLAIQKILPRLASLGDLDAAELIFANASVRTGFEFGAVLSALKLFEEPQVLERFARTLADEDVSADWRSLLIERLADVRTPLVSETLVELIDSRVEGSTIHLRAIELCGERLEYDAERPLLKVLRGQDEPARYGAIVALGRIMGADSGWRARLFELAQEDSPAARIGACVALAELRTVEAITRLHELLEDEERAVRIEAVQQVGNLRRKESLPLLIERLEVEQGRLRQDVAAVLRLMTGTDNGTSAVRWGAWWEGEGQRFELPSYEDALAAEKERRKRRADDVSVSTFYGLQVLSSRVYFVVDVSGSMAGVVKGQEGADGEGPPTRLEIAKRELGRALEAYPDGDQFNLVFFESRVRTWQDELVPMSQRNRSKALEFLTQQRPSGGTALFDGLMAAMNDERVDTIFLLADGLPGGGKITDPGRIRAEIARINTTRKIRIHGISIGRPSTLLRDLAADTGGQYREES